MKRFLLKSLLIIITFFVGMTIFSIMRVSGQFGVLPMWIVAAGMFAAIGAIWKYQPKSSKEISLDKDD
ncbi:hypothetical protein [Sulfurimonas xiamenensis]|uniref:Uncharacterized protein n=1 Tax=Sulfurimonas xiamenensis TaxID=2590021 RepID=A0AAJ4A2V7_9BACT|nr:hypothetical protein [Sulfurimonas xiamenensis]QFR42870.1 hypothetical protein FJR47_02675 [Sulfurimonas xiamenensis]